MRHKRWLPLLFTLGLMVCSIGGCRTGSRPSWNEAGSVLDMLALADQTISSLEIVKAGGGHDVIIEDSEQIKNVLDRLSQVQIIKNVGNKGYSLGGYGLAFSVVTPNEIKKVSIQITVAEGDDFAHYGGVDGYYYEISDQGSDELNDYFELAKYAYR
jgi:hypothetical protein